MHCSVTVMQKTDLRLITLRNRRLGASAGVGRHDSDECKQGLVNGLRIDRGEIAANHAIPFEASVREPQALSDQASLAPKHGRREHRSG